jgi:hypothetical protein
VTARYRAPAGDGELLAIPPLETIAHQIATNAERLDRSAASFGNIPVPELRRAAVTEIIEASRRYLAEAGEPVPPVASRLISAGHQPEFFHPGVWVKNFALSGLAQKTGHAALNLIVDNDTVRSTAIRVPHLAVQPGAVKSLEVPFDGSRTDLPYEEYQVAERGLFDSFPKRLQEHTQSWGYCPLACPAWPQVSREIKAGVPFVEASSRLRRSLERRWGATNFELPVSRLSATDAFARFVWSILDGLPAFVDAYNGAIRDYRAANKLRSKNHPAPDLERAGNALEAPFWVWRADSPRRAKLFVARVENGFELRASGKAIAEVPSAIDAFLKHWRHLADAGWKIRPRALTLTLFVRLCLADGFIHGIGGGKYDEVTDEIIRRAFGIEPPSYAVVSATLRLPIPRFPASTRTLRSEERHLRDLEWNPQEFPDAQSRLPALVQGKRELIRHEPAARVERRAWFRKLQELTRKLREPLTPEIESSSHKLEGVHAELAANAVLASREYSWLLFPEAQLRDYFRQFVRD